MGVYNMQELAMLLYGMVHMQAPIAGDWLRQFRIYMLYLLRNAELVHVRPDGTARIGSRFFE